MRAALLVIGLSYAALAFYVAAPITPKPVPTPLPTLGPTREPLKRTPVPEKAMQTLETELLRRFHESNNVDFGMARLIRPNVRLHRGPVMGKRVEFTNKEIRSNGKSKQFLIDGEWLEPSVVRDVMTPENVNERDAMRAFKQAGIDVAIYTAGVFDDKGIPYRLKGPAYLTKGSVAGPAPEILKAIGATAMAGSEAPAAGPNDWVYRAVRVTANNQLCINCHNFNRFYTAPPEKTVSGQTAGRPSPFVAKELPPAHFKIGDTLGFILIGTRPKHA
jgi:hypothetical protein